jgi:hypothetical protein
MDDRSTTERPSAEDAGGPIYTTVSNPRRIRL